MFEKQYLRFGDYVYHRRPSSEWQGLLLYISRVRNVPSKK